MFKTLYFRMVLAFIAVVIISGSLSSILFTELFKKQQPLQFQEDLLQTGETLIHLIQNHDLKLSESSLNQIAGLHRDIVTLYTSADGEHVLENEAAQSVTDVSKQDVAQVLAGVTYNPFQDGKTGTFPPMSVGLPLTFEGIHYAIFIRHNRDDNMPPLPFRLPLFELVVVSCIGSVIIIFLSRYFVLPITKLAQAAKEMAQGNFNVEVLLKRKDELGLLADNFNHMAGELKQIERMRQDFVTNVSHELQTPLTSMRGFSKALQNDWLGKEEKSYCLSVIDSESERLSHLVDNMLRLTSLESMHHPYDPRPYYLDEQLRRVLMVNHLMMSQKGITYEVTLPKTLIKGDENQLFQVWTNLLYNSIKFTPVGGSISINIKKETDAVSVRISDTGIGIPDEDQPFVFGRFYKANKSRDRSEGGNGLGLAIVKKIVDIHHGEISLESSLGKGTTFTVKLPKLAET